MEPAVENSETALAEADDQPQTMGRFNKWDTPWLNPKMIIGVGIIILLFLAGVVDLAPEPEQTSEDLSAIPLVSAVRHVELPPMVRHHCLRCGAGGHGRRMRWL